MFKLNFSYESCLNKVIMIRLSEDGEINSEFMIINNINDYNELVEYIKYLINKNILDNYFIYNN